MGIDAHKNFLQIEAMDRDGKVWFAQKITNTHKDIRRVFSKLPKDLLCVTYLIWPVVSRVTIDFLDL